MKRQKKRQNGDNSDRLSNLPDHLLLHIIEFMPIKLSIQTCVLSKRWKDLWKSLTKLLLHHLRDKKSVSHILSGRDVSLPLHTLIYYHIISKNYKRKNLHLDLETKLLDVMKYGASHNMKHLIVGVDLGLIKNLELPPSIFHCHSLTALKLEFWHPASHDDIKILFPKSLNLPALKSLYLAFLTFTTNEEIGCAEPFSTCNMLSELVIVCCCLQDDAKALCISNSNVSFIVVRDTCSYTRVSYKNVVFCTPKLTFLSFMGLPCFVSASECKLPFLEEGNIDHGNSDCPFKETLLIDWLHLLAHVKKMHFSFRTLCEIHTFQKKYPTNIVPCFVRLKLLKVRWRSDSQIFDEIIIGKVKEMVPCLLQNSLHAKVDIILQAGSTTGELEAGVGARMQWMWMNRKYILKTVCQRL